MNMMRVLQEHNRTFFNWFRESIFVDDSASRTLRLLAVGPNLNLPTWKGYDINNYSFYTKYRMIKVVCRMLDLVASIILRGIGLEYRRSNNNQFNNVL